MANPTTIYRFTNATLVKGGRLTADVVLLEDGEQLGLERNLLTPDVLKKLGIYGQLHRKSYGELKLQRSELSQEVVNYVPVDSGTELRELSEDDYSRLSPSFQKLYRQQLTAPVEVKKDLDFELKEIDYPLSEAVILGVEYLTELHELILKRRDKEARIRSWGGYSDSDPSPQLARNLPLELDSKELLAVIDHIGDGIRNGGNFAAQVQVVSFPREGGKLRIGFLSSPYEGAMKKVLSKKSNGQPYADRRGRMVRDMPAPAGAAEITESEIMGWWRSIGGEQLSDEEKLKALDALTRKFWVV